MTREILKEMVNRAPLNFKIASEIAYKHNVLTRAVIASAIRNQIDYDTIKGKKRR